MAKKGQLCHCDICGQEVRVTRDGPGTLHCCSVPMALIDEQAPPGRRPASK